MNIGGFDIETSKKPNFLPWFKGYFLSVISISYPNNTARSWVFIHDENVIDIKTYKLQLLEIEVELNSFDIIAAHNLKFDLNQLKKLNLTSSKHCTMVAEYLLNFQNRNNLSLDDLSPKYNLPLKIDKIKIMWDSGLDTNEIPLSTLIKYCEDDARKTRVIAKSQQQALKQRGLTKIFKIQMSWLVMLSDMECNGIIWDINKATNIIKTYKKYRSILTSKIKNLIEPFTKNVDIQLTSNDELSALIYGGQIKRNEKRSVIKTKNVKVKMPFLFTYKNGITKIKSKWCSHPNTKIIRRVLKDIWYDVAGLQITPNKKTELSKSTEKRRYYKTDKGTLPFLITNTLIQKRIIKLLIKLSSVNKVITTFVNEDKNTGLINKIGIDGKLHTNYNQAVTATGRLSSSNPNSQNLPRGNTSPIKQCIKG